ncbi:MAG: glycosyltransferase [Sandaracinaceae bacterium]|nr:glycosyltransferase [Sandaracinaceae bacterium]
MDWVPYILLGCSATALILFGLGILATLRHTRRAPFELPDEAYLPVSLLKPLKGLEEGLEDNLRSFFEQDYPAPLEIVFAATDPADPALAVARRLAREHTGIPVRFAFSDPAFGLNPKVANLAGALRVARYELCLQSDANVRARPDYLRRVVAELVHEDAQLLSSMVAGVGERSTGALLDNLQLSAFTAPGTCFALSFGIVCVIGKSMLFYKKDLAEVGGLEAVRDLLAEDYVLGRMFQKAGKKVLLSTTTAENVNIDGPVEHFVSRHARWLKMRAVVHVPGFVADLFANPTGLALLAFLTSGLDWRFGLVLAAITVVKSLGDAFLVERTRGVPLSTKHRFLTPLRDVLMLGIWPYAAFSRSVEWRGVPLRLGWGSRLRPDDGPLPIRLMRWVLAPLRG